MVKRCAFILKTADGLTQIRQDNKTQGVGVTGTLTHEVRSQSGHQQLHLTDLGVFAPLLLCVNCLFEVHTLLRGNLLQKNEGPGENPMVKGFGRNAINAARATRR